MQIQNAPQIEQNGNGFTMNQLIAYADSVIKKKQNHAMAKAQQVDAKGEDASQKEMMEMKVAFSDLSNAIEYFTGSIEKVDKAQSRAAESISR
ncbi:hypothetical protein [Burkholderia ubonensis]|uniref:hypothetical protein n=1 Tax=Burkholderia ubonensis TaxID=101571 RepID=UPI00075AB353|nr:hypothetical protein [Burkholderia ubonensis]KVW73123.1 hypothetical protein WK99_32990 [Burkholderia ubonensis]